MLAMLEYLNPVLASRHGEGPLLQWRQTLLLPLTEGDSMLLPSWIAKGKLALVGLYPDLPGTVRAICEHSFTWDPCVSLFALLADGRQVIVWYSPSQRRVEWAFKLRAAALGRFCQ
jgi:hypothetical protein